MTCQEAIGLLVDYLDMDEQQLTAHFFRFADACAGFNAVAARFVAGGDAAGAVAHNLHDDDRSIAQARLHLLLDRGEEGIEIHE